MIVLSVEGGMLHVLKIRRQLERRQKLHRVERFQHVFVFVVDGLLSFRGLAPDESHAEQIVPQLWNQAGVTERSLHNEAGTRLRGSVRGDLGAAEAKAAEPGEWRVCP